LFCQAWWYKPVIPALRKLWQEDHDLQVSLSYIPRPCLKKIIVLWKGVYAVFLGSQTLCEARSGWKTSWALRGRRRLKMACMRRARWMQINLKEKWGQGWGVPHLCQVNALGIQR
jgi:hypothetical protein